MAYPWSIYEVSMAVLVPFENLEISFIDQFGRWSMKLNSLNDMKKYIFWQKFLANNFFPLLPTPQQVATHFCPAAFGAGKNTRNDLASKDV